MKKAVIFDLDGTLLDTLQDLAAAANWALRHNGLPERTLDEVRQFVGNGVGKLMERAVGLPANEALTQRALSDFKSYYVAHCQDATCLYPGIREILQMLRQRGIRTAIVSNKLQAGVTELHRAYFSDLVEVAVGERPEVRRKPAPDMVFVALRELDVAPEEALYVGDSDVDIQTAAAAHMPCISVLWGFRDRDFLLAHGAKELASHPDELLNYL